MRRRAELTPLQGAGYCSDPDCFEKTEQCADIRFEQKPCNDMKCDNNVACNSKIDLLLLLDGSGSVRPKGFKKEKKFAEDLLSRMTISEEGAKAGSRRALALTVTLYGGRYRKHCNFANGC